MSLLLLLSIAIVLYLLLSRAVMPRLEASAETSSLRVRVGKSGLLAAAKFAADLSFLAIGVYGLFAVAALLMGLTFGHNVTLLGGAVHIAESGKTGLKTIKGLYGSITFGFLVCAFVFLTWRQRRDAISGKTRLLYDRDEDRCNRERESDPSAWDSIAPSEAMVAIDAEMQGLVSEMPKFASDDAHGERLWRIRTLGNLKEKRLREDYARRADVEAINLALRAAQRDNSWSGLLSKGFYADMKLGSKLIARTGTVLALVTLVGLGQAAGVNQMLAAKLIHLDDLRVEAEDGKVEAEWKKGLAERADAATMTADDKQAMGYLADQFARALLQNPAWRVQAAASTERDAQRLMTQEVVLQQFSLPTPDGRMESAYHANLSQEERGALDTAVPAEGHITALGQELAETEGPEIKRWFGSRWDGVKKAAAVHKATYADPLQAADLRQDALDKTLATILKEKPAGAGEVEIFLPKSGVEMGNDVLKSIVHEMVPEQFHRMFEEYASGVPLNDVLRHVRTAAPSITEQHIRDIAAVMHANHAPDPAKIVSTLRDDPGNWPPSRDGAGTSANAEPGPSSPRPSGGVTEVVDDISKAKSMAFHESNVSEQDVEGLAEYDDFFPKTEAAAKGTVMAQEVTSHGGEVAGVAEDVAFRVERAASFGMLQGFSRVGGVLIGREPENPSKHLDLRQLDWMIVGRQVTVRLRDASGKTTELAPVDKSLVHQALAYAADGRPVAVTMTTAQPMRFLKVQLHPALVDTPIGCRVSQLDRLVDTFADYDALPQRKEMVNAVELQLAVYDYAWAARLSNLDTLPNFNDSSLAKRIAEALDGKDDLAKGLTQPALLTRDGVIKQKPAFFDPTLVDAIKSCRDTGAKSFGTCVKSQFSSVELTKDTVGLWLRKTAFIPWSGVRERPFQVTEDLSFLKRPAPSDPSNRLWPFDFLIQVSFTTPAVNAPTANDRYADQDPMEFKSLRTDLQKLVDGGINKKGLGPSFEDLRNFAVLQRLFRLALHGNLGDRFPVTRLAALEHDTAGGIPYIHTARWQSSNVYTDSIQLDGFNARLKAAKIASTWSTAAVLQSHACAEALRSAMQHEETSTLPACNMEASRDLAVSACKASMASTACLWANNPFVREDLEGSLKLERAFGVLDDQVKKLMLAQKMPDRTGESDGPCAPLQPAVSQGGQPL